MIKGTGSALAPGWIRILRPDDVTVVSHPTRDTKVIGISSYWRLHLGDKVSIMSIKLEDPQGSVTLVAARIHVHRR